MRLLVLINNYQGTHSDNTDAGVQRVLRTFNAYTQMDVDIVLFSTRPLETAGAVHVTYPAELEHSFAYAPRQWLVENFCCLEHDYVMYTENDLIVSEESVLNCIANNHFVGRISEKFITGFIRYEFNKVKEYIDMLPCVRPTVEKVFRAPDGRKFWIPGNIHSGNFLLSHQQLEQMIARRLFQVNHAQYGKQYYGILESAASDVYLDYIKLLPEDFTTVEIEHVSSKYHGLTHEALREEIESPSGKIGC